jgi:hypothetical protein
MIAAGGRGTGDEAGDAVLDAGAQAVGGVDQHAVDDRRAAHVGHLVAADELEDQRRVDLAQADVDAGVGSAMVQGKHQPLQWNIGSVHR